MPYTDEAANIAIAILPYVRSSMTKEQADLTIESADANEGYVALT